MDVLVVASTTIAKNGSDVVKVAARIPLEFGERV
jgi:hypothetical protein